jgi:hypothetical protein
MSSESRETLRKLQPRLTPLPIKTMPVAEKPPLGLVGFALIQGLGVA